MRRASSEARCPFLPAAASATSCCRRGVPKLPSHCTIARATLCRPSTAFCRALDAEEEYNEIDEMATGLISRRKGEALPPRDTQVGRVVTSMVCVCCGVEGGPLQCSFSAAGNDWKSSKHINKLIS